MQEPVSEVLLVSQLPYACSPLLIPTEKHGKPGVCVPLIVAANGKLPPQLVKGLDKGDSTWMTILDAT